MAYFIGLDSGGTKTECVLADETRVLGVAACGTVKLTRVGVEIATARLEGLLAEVSAAAGVPLTAITRTCAGVAGFSIAAVREWAARVVGACVAGEVVVLGDDTIALDAAFRGGPGVLLIGGTGSVAIGRRSGGDRVSAGGWGPAVGDEGSGFWIGREAVRRGLRGLDRGEASTLLGAINAAWQVESAGALTALAHAHPAPDFAALAPVVMRCAEQGDAVARVLLRDAGEHLADHVAVVWRAMQAAGETRAEVAWTGSLLEKIAAVRSSMEASVRQTCPELTVLRAPVHSLEGALWHARGGASPS